jgi:hypothetical protein
MRDWVLSGDPELVEQVKGLSLAMYVNDPFIMKIGKRMGHVCGVVTTYKTLGLDVMMTGITNNALQRVSHDKSNK